MIEQRRPSYLRHVDDSSCEREEEEEEEEEIKQLIENWCLCTRMIIVVR
jgi:hypothetical protein